MKMRLDPISAAIIAVALVASITGTTAIVVGGTDWGVNQVRINSEVRIAEFKVADEWAREECKRKDIQLKYQTGQKLDDETIVYS